MSFNAGDFTEANYKHPTEGNGTLFLVSNQDSNTDRGGFRSEDDANLVTADGQLIDKVNRVRWSLELVIAWDLTGRDELQKLSNLAESSEVANWTFTHISGAVYGAKGKPVGDVVGNANNAQVAQKFAGGGKLEKIG